MLTHATVWLENECPDVVAFAHALEWATRLGLTLYGVHIPGQNPGHPRAGQPSFARATREWWPERRLTGKSGDWTLDSCADACRRNGVEWVECDWLDAPPIDAGLSVIGQFLPNGWPESLLKTTGGGAAAFTLFCSPEWAPLRRVLILNNTRRADSDYLRRAAVVCSLFSAAAAVLTTAPSEFEARQGQEFARRVLDAEGQAADYDYAAGCELHTAIQVEATCRRCSHVFVDGGALSARRRFGFAAGQALASHLSRSLTVLTFPEGASIGFKRPDFDRSARMTETTQHGQ